MKSEARMGLAEYMVISKGDGWTVLHDARRDDAHVAAGCGCFTEGFDTLDLKEAKALPS
jgi:hypothetical protein